MHDGKTCPTLILFHSENSLQLSGYITSQNSRYSPAKKPMLTHEVLLNDFTVGVWCSTSATACIKPTFITTNPQRCVSTFWHHFLNTCHATRTLTFFSSKAVQAILCAVQTALSQCNISSELWPPHLPDQNLQFEFYLWKHSKCDAHNSTNRSLTNEHVFKSDICVPAKGNYSQHLHKIWEWHNINWHTVNWNGRKCCNACHNANLSSSRG